MRSFVRPRPVVAAAANEIAAHPLNQQKAQAIYISAYMPYTAPFLAFPLMIQRLRFFCHCSLGDRHFLFCLSFKALPSAP